MAQTDPPLAALVPCNIGQSTNRVWTFLSATDAVGIESEIKAGGQSIGLTDPSGYCSFYLNPCSSAQFIEAWPTHIGYCPESYRCESSISIEVFPGCSARDSVFEGRGARIPWLDELRSVLGGSIPQQVDGVEIAALNQEIINAYDETNFVSATAAAADLTSLLIEVGEIDFAWDTSVLQLDAAFRAVGLEPAGNGALLLQRIESGRVLPTQLGFEALSVIDAGINDVIFNPDDGFPFVLSRSALEIIASAGESNPIVLHPSVVENFSEYILRN